MYYNLDYNNPHYITILQLCGDTYQYLNDLTFFIILDVNQIIKSRANTIHT